MTPPALDKRLVEHLTWKEYEQAVKDNKIFLLVAGAVEEHGSHLPLGFDAMMGYEIALELANRYPAVVMPTLMYGYRSQATIGGGDQYPGTTCIGAEALIYTVHDILEDTLRHGVRRFAFINSHLENQSFLVEGIELFRRRHDLEKLGCKVLITGWAPFVKDSTLDALFEGNFPGWDPEHAGLLETSAMLGINPDVVDMDKLPDESASRYPKYTTFPTPPDIVTRNGALAPAGKSSIENGKLILTDVFEGYAQTFWDEFKVKPLY